MQGKRHAIRNKILILCKIDGGPNIQGSLPGEEHLGADVSSVEAAVQYGCAGGQGDICR